MATRFNTGSKNRLGISPLPSGYESQQGKPEFFMPPCGIEDVDIAMFNLFDKEIVPMCGGQGQQLAKVPIVFAAGEKWAMLKKGRALRDANNTLIIPLITIVRADVTQDVTDVVGRGINQQTGEIIIRRRLDKSDRDYQALINKFFLRGQSNLAVPSTVPLVQGEQLSTSAAVGSLSDREDMLTPDLKNNVWETIVVPAPQFYTVKYQVTIWTQYIQHANQIIEKLFASYLPQAQSWRLDTKKGYWFVATVDGGAYASETNFDDIGTNERFIKHTFTVNVPAYFFVTRSPGTPVPIKRYVSSPIISFDAGIDPGSNDEYSDLDTNEYVLGADDPTLPRDTHANDRADQRPPGWRQQKVYPINEGDIDDPAIDIRLSSRRRIRETARNRRGETSYVGATLGGLQIVFDDK